MDRRAFTLGPLVVHGALQPGTDRLSCSVGGVEYFADLGPNGEILFEGQAFRSPSAFSVYVKRKVNPSRKADDGWTSVHYNGELLSLYRGQLEDLLAADGRSNLTASPLRTSNLTASGKPKRKRAAKPQHGSELDDYSSDDVEASVGPVRSGRGTNRAAASPGPPDYGEVGMPAAARSPSRRARTPPASLRQDAADGAARVAGGDSAVASADPAAWTFVQCENVDCMKWRKVAARNLDSNGAWVCAMNTDRRFASCGVPPQFTDEEIDRQLEAADTARHLSHCRRRPLGQCSEREFEEDLYAFLTERGEGELANDLRNKRINCNNSPIDIFGLYREVIKEGGYIANERYDDYNRWVGSINFGGRIFPAMRNFTPNNRATSIGNQLINNYRKFLLAYERHHRPRDLPAPPVSEGASDALAVLADVAGNAVDEMEVAGQHDVPRGARSVSKGPRAPGGKRAPDGVDDGDAPAGMRARSGSHVSADATMGAAAANAARRVVAALRQAEGSSGRSLAGTLLLAQDPSDLNRHWPVLVAAANDVPRSVAAGGCLPTSAAFPLPLQEACASGRPEQALPVLVIGTQMLGWVEAAACRRYSASAGEAATVAMQPDAAQRPSEPSRDGALSAQCARALKVAAQYNRCGDTHLTLARSMGAAAGARAVSARLADLEARLPADGATKCASFRFWEAWRRSVARADSAAELAPLVLALAHQLAAGALRPGAAGPLWGDLACQLDMLGAEGGAEAPDGRSATHAPSEGPTVLGADDAVSTLEAAVDWGRLRRPLQPGAWALEPGAALRNGLRIVAGPGLKSEEAAGSLPVPQTSGAGAAQVVSDAGASSAPGSPRSRPAVFAHGGARGGVLGGDTSAQARR
ncbi:hypothetical protein WJX81_003853 [Elliptochloris bilobata]|uniref:CW-type domain-containing protein n=1 Tax=Elliptochloris bilobata TaxID=381761 RepID=A0AAW1SK05_9CHLO